jgi:ribosomal protein S18 acetylase RimI-like enzyme
MTVSVRLAAPGDVETIARFNQAMAQETERRTLDPDRLRRGVRAVLEDASKGRYWVAESDGRLVGQLLITFEWSDWRNGAFWWIQSVYVDPEFRGCGVFRSLYEHVAREAQAAPGVCGLRLYVEQDNRRAQEAYERLGMKRTPYLIYEVDFVLGR